jgi:hypothetical protein
VTSDEIAGDPPSLKFQRGKHACRYRERRIPIYRERSPAPTQSPARRMRYARSQHAS